MHFEPGLVDGAKIVLSYATAAAAAIYYFTEATRQAASPPSPRAR